MGRRIDDNRSTSFNGHAGVMLSSKDEVLPRWSFIRRMSKLYGIAGITVISEMATSMRWKYNISEDDYVLGAARKFDERWLLRYEYAHDTRLGEFGLRYKLHDFAAWSISPIKRTAGCD